MKRLLVTGFAVTVLTGCGAGALKQASSGFTGCAPSEISISNDDVGFSQRSWDAMCHGRLDHCSGIGQSMSCREGDTAGSSASAAETSSGHEPSPAIVAAARPKRSWSHYASKACDLGALLPGVPVEEQSTVRSTLGDTVIHSATVDLKSAIVTLRCYTVAAKGPSDPGTVLDQARNSILEDTGATFESEHDIVVSGVPGRDFNFLVGRDRGRVRLLLRERQVVSMVFAPVATFSAPEVRAFFSGLEIPRGDVTSSAIRP